jgi:hypothetical protein
LVFYTGLHLIRAYAVQCKVSIGDSHKELQVAMKNQGASVPNLDVDVECTNNYTALYSASRQARYDGMDDSVLFEARNLRSLKFAKLKLQKIKNHLQSKGLPI